MNHCFQKCFFICRTFFFRWHILFFITDCLFSQLQRKKKLVRIFSVLCKTKTYKIWNYLYVPPARKLVFSLQLRVAQCCVLRYRGMKCKNWTAHALYICTFELRMLYYNTLPLHKINKIKIAGSSRELSSVMEENHYRLDSSVRIKTRIRTKIT